MRYQNDQGVVEASEKKKTVQEVLNDDGQKQENVEAGAAGGDETGKDGEKEEKGANETGNDDGEEQNSDEAKEKAEAEAETEVENDSSVADAETGVEKDDGKMTTDSTENGTVEAAKAKQSASDDEKSEDNKPSMEPASSDKPETSGVAEMVSIVSQIKPKDRESLSEEQMRSMDNPSAAAPHLADNRTLEQNPFMRMMMDRIKPNAQMTGGINYQPIAMPLRRGSLPGSMMSQRGEDSNGFFPPHQYRKVSTGDISEGVSNRSSMCDSMMDSMMRRASSSSMQMSKEDISEGFSNRGSMCDSMMDSMMRRASSSSMQMSKEDKEDFERFMMFKRKAYMDMERGGGV